VGVMDWMAALSLDSIKSPLNTNVKRVWWRLFLEFHFPKQNFAYKIIQKAAASHFLPQPNPSMYDISRPHFSQSSTLTTCFSSPATGFSLSLPLFSLYNFIPCLIFFNFY